MDDQLQERDPVSEQERTREKVTIRYSASAQVGILVGFTLLGFAIGNFAAVVPFLLKGIGIARIVDAIGNPAYADLSRLAQVISTFFTFLVPVWLFGRIVAPKEDYLKVRTHSPSRVWLLVLLLAFASMPVTDLMGTINYAIPLPKNWAVRFQQLEDNYNAQVANIMQMHSVWDLLVSLVIVALLPAVFEEAFFRGGLQNVLLRWFRHPLAAIVVTSIIFSAIHVSYYGFIPRVFLGILLGYIYYRTKDIKLNMLVHFINNAVSVLTMYQLARAHQLTPEKMNTHLEWYWQIAGTVVFAVLLLRFYRNTGNESGKMVS